MILQYEHIANGFTNINDYLSFYYINALIIILQEKCITNDYYNANAFLMIFTILLHCIWLLQWKFITHDFTIQMH